MYKYHCLNPISPVGMGQLDANYENTENAADADVILVRSAKMHEMEFGENLKAIARAGAGVNNIPLDRCAEKGIVVFNTPGANANGVKELVIAGMLLAARDKFPSASINASTSALSSGSRDSISRANSSRNISPERNSECSSASISRPFSYSRGRASRSSSLFFRFLSRK